jgi:hypothetical protein
MVKATSKTGDDLYVQPYYWLNNETQIPVAIGTLYGEDLEDLSSGDYVNIQLGGVDFEKGQVSCRVLSKLDDDAAKVLQAKEPLMGTFHQLGKTFGSLKPLRNLNGVYCKGVVKEISESGDLFQVQPFYWVERNQVPVAVGRLFDDEEDVSTGDFVHIRLGGLDEKGQVKCKIIKKMSEEAVQNFKEARTKKRGIRKIDIEKKQSKEKRIQASKKNADVNS